MSLRLLAVGLLVGLLSAFYPSLPSLRPYVPFLGTPSADSSSWTSYQRFQASHPPAANHDPFDLEEPKEERRRRMESKEGDKEREREMKRKERESEGRREAAGNENRVLEGVPAYWVTQDGWAAQLEREIASLQPTALVILTAHSSPALQLSAPPSPVLTSLQSILHAHAIHSRLAAPVEAPFTGIETVRMELPNREFWGEEEYFKLGRGMAKLREEGVLLVAVGASSHPPPSLTHALTDHTSHPREIALEQLGFGASGAEGLWVVVGAAGEAEGVELREGAGWRFGEVEVGR